jgi:hypothetical protein
MILRLKDRAAVRIAVATLLFGMPLGAVAQTPPPAKPAAAQGAAATDQRAVARADARIAELHTKLRITPAQQPQWDAFAAVMRDNARNTEAIMATRGDPKTMTALQEMRGYTEMAVAHAADMQKMLPPFEALYNAMSPEQQKLADAVFRQQGIRRNR